MALQTAEPLRTWARRPRACAGDRTGPGMSASLARHEEGSTSSQPSAVPLNPVLLTEGNQSFRGQRWPHVWWERRRAGAPRDAGLPCRSGTYLLSRRPLRSGLSQCCSLPHHCILPLPLKSVVSLPVPCSLPGTRPPVCCPGTARPVLPASAEAPPSRWPPCCLSGAPRRAGPLPGFQNTFFLFHDY